MRRSLKLLLLLGVGLLMAKPKGGGDGPDGPDGNDIDPLTGRPKDSAEREERLNFQGKNASTEMAEVHDTAKTEAESGRAADSTSQASTTDQTDLAYTGGAIRPRDRLDPDQQEQWASEAYDYFTQNNRDIDAIAENLADFPRQNGQTGFTPEEIEIAKNNFMSDSHIIDNSWGDPPRYGRFDPDPEQASAWIRLVNGNPSESDIVLLEHELAEGTYFQNNPDAPYSEAHNYANSIANWQNEFDAGNVPQNRERYDVFD
ncbi:hypothetical protein [Glycomyces sp. MUSA5-2]|uniref:hypothetical protein n=1 Tax=Glycomyces sp. MUSA5-2 TaxID=2053002 RepID=UPI0030084B25